MRNKLMDHIINVIFITKTRLFDLVIEASEKNNHIYIELRIENGNPKQMKLMSNNDTYIYHIHIFKLF